MVNKTDACPYKEVRNGCCSHKFGNRKCIYSDPAKCEFFQRWKLSHRIK